MGTKWALNLFLPTTLSDVDMAHVPAPRTELYIHVTYKTVQAGTILGVGIFGPLIAMIRRRPFGATCLKAGRIGALIGIPAGPVMTELTLNKTKSTEAMVWDRCYRLRYNRSQVRVDRACTYGMVAGGALGAFTSAVTPVNGVILGIFLSTVGAGFYNNVIVKEETIFNPRKKAAEEKHEDSVEKPEA